MVDWVAGHNHLRTCCPTARFRSITLGEAGLQAIIDGSCQAYDSACTDDPLAPETTKLYLSTGQVFFSFWQLGTILQSIFL